MKKMSEYKISTKLILVFSIVFMLSLLTTGIAMWRLKNVADSIENLMDKPMLKYQTANNWYGNSNAAITRTTIISRSSDTAELTKEFSAEAKRTTEESSKFQKTVEENISSPDEKALFDRIAVVRQTYLSSRKEVEKLKNESKPEEARKVYTDVYLPAAKEYAGSLYKLVEWERDNMISTSKEAKVSYQHGRTIIIILSTITLLLGLILSLLLTKNILKELGGEPKYAADVVKEIAAGNLAVKIETANVHKDSLVSHMEQMRKNLYAIVTEVRTSSDSIMTASTEIADGNQDLSSRTEQQASSLEETASSMEEFSSTVKQNADNAKYAHQLVNATVTSAKEGGKVVHEVIDTMSLIKESSKKVSDIISVIDGIAFQTNILALNAAVEAARAGEQGRGFAVVAGEVRNLAQRSASAAKEIKELINDSVNKVETGVQLVNRAGVSITDVVTHINSVSDVMNEITEASKEQSLGIEEVTKAVSQMDSVTQQNAALVEEAAAAADMLQDQTKNLNQLMNKFTV